MGYRVEALHSGVILMMSPTNVCSLGENEDVKGGGIVKKC